MVTPSPKAFMEKALALATISLNEGCAPIGAVLVNRQGFVVGSGRSTIKPSGDKDKAHVSINHVELSLIQAYQDSMTLEDSPYTLYVTLEPCHMCMGAAIVARISKVVWALDDYWGGATRIYNIGREYMQLRLPDLTRTPYPDLQKKAADMWVEHLAEYNLSQFVERMLRWQHRVEA